MFRPLPMCQRRHTTITFPVTEIVMHQQHYRPAINALNSLFKPLTEVTEEESDGDGRSEDSQVNELIGRHGSGNTGTVRVSQSF